MTTNILGVEHPDWEERPEVPDRTAPGGAGAGSRPYYAGQPARESDEGERLDYWSASSPEQDGDASEPDSTDWRARGERPQVTGAPDDEPDPTSGWRTRSQRPQMAGTPDDEPDPTSGWPTRSVRPRVAGAPTDDDWVSRPDTPRTGGGPTPLPNTPARPGSGTAPAAGAAPGGWPLRPESLRPGSSANHPTSGPAGGGSTPTPRGSILPPGAVAGSEFWPSRTDITGSGPASHDGPSTGGAAGASSGITGSDSWSSRGTYGGGSTSSTDYWGARDDTSTGSHAAEEDHWSPPRAAVRSAPPAPPGSTSPSPDSLTSTGEQRRIGGRHEAPSYDDTGHDTSPHANDAPRFGHDTAPYSSAPDPGSDAFWASRFAAGPWSEPEAPPRAEERSAPGVPEDWARPDRPRPFSAADAWPDREPALAPPGERALALRRTEVDRVAVEQAPADDVDDEDHRDYGAVLLATVLWYLLPTLAYTMWAITRSSEPPAGCTTLTGAACPSPRADAFGLVGDHWLVIIATGVLSLVIALMFRRFTPAWRAISVGFAAAVIGAGVTTLAHSLFG